MMQKLSIWTAVSLKWKNSMHGFACPVYVFLGDTETSAGVTARNVCPV